jgi:hypothetical protein
MAKTNRRAWGLAAVLAVVAVGGAGALALRPWVQDWVDLYQFLNSPVLREIPFRNETAQRIIAAVRNGTLSADRNGQIILPPWLAAASKDGRVYVTHKGNGLRLFLFPTWQGKGGNVRGYLFCSRPLTKSEEKQGAIDLAYLARPSPNPHMDPPVGAMLERKVSANWYYVSGSLD